jgi:hypothetical protein
LTLGSARLKEEESSGGKASRPYRQSRFILDITASSFEKISAACRDNSPHARIEASINTLILRDQELPLTFHLLHSDPRPAGELAMAIGALVLGMTDDGPLPA